MPLTIPVLESLTWPWPIWTMHVAYLLSGLFIAVHYVPQLRRAWRFPAATLDAQSLSTWSVWTLCRVVAFIYGVVVLHDLVFLVVVGADMFGRLAMVVSIVRAHARINALRWSDPEAGVSISLSRARAGPERNGYARGARTPRQRTCSVS
jgi:hypothetical protein